MTADEKKAATPGMRPIRAPKKFTRREIEKSKPDVKRFLKGDKTELEFMQYLRGIEIFDEDPRFARAVEAYRLAKKGKL